MLHYVDCNAVYINSTDINNSLMPDGLHPNHIGMGLLAQASGMHAPSHVCTAHA